MTCPWLLVAISSLLPALPAAKTSAPRTDAAQALATQLRGLVLDIMPDPLHEDLSKWNRQKKNSRGKLKNDGRWLKYRITGRNLREKMELRIEDVRKEASRSTFNVKIAFDAYVELDRQTWLMGMRLYSGSTRARFRIYLTMTCELTSRVEKGKGWLPDMIIRLRVLNSQFHYDHVVVEHTAGVGGDMAKVLGELMLGIVKAAKPNLERDLGNKINAAIVKAGDTKEVRVRLSDFLAGKSLPAPKPQVPPVKK